MNGKKETIILLMQETWESDNKVKYINGITFISHGKKTTNSRKRSEVGIVLCPKETQAWMEAGQPDPIQPEEIAGAIRNIGLKIIIKNSKGKNITILLISTYLPCS